MANAAYLASTLLMGLLGVGVVVLVLRGRHWENYRPQAAYGMDAGGGAPPSALSKVAGATGTWTVGFFLLALGFLGAVVVTVSGGIGGTAVIAGLGAAVVLQIVAGVYVALRGNGRPSSIAVAGSVVTLGLLFIAIIALDLILGL
jgi:hypothetical protein